MEETVKDKIFALLTEADLLMREQATIDGFTYAAEDAEDAFGECRAAMDAAFEVLGYYLDE